MSDSLTTLISKIQALLGDDGTIFTTATCTAAVRNALNTYNQFAPVHAADLFDAVTDQYEYEVSDQDTRAMEVLDVLLQGDNANELDLSLTYDDYSEDERLWFRLRAPQTTGKTLIVRYTIPHTVNGLDSQSESTIPAWQNQILVMGSAAEALRSRAYARVETINLNQDVSNNYKELATIYRDEFTTLLRSISSRKSAPVGEPDTRAWNDQYHYWGQ
jgi:hypothetical protein